MTNYLNTSIFIVLFTQFILCEVTVVSEERFNKLLNDNTCKNIKYGKCYDFLNESISFRNHQKNNYLKSERIFITETPKKHTDFKHIYEISKSGIVYYLPKYILETNSSKINSEHILSKGDDIIVYHLFNKVFFVEIKEIYVEEINPTYPEETNSKPKITEITNNQIKKIDYSGPTRNSKAGYDIRLTEKDFEFVKQALKISDKYKDLLSFVKILENLNNKIDCKYFLNIEYVEDNDGIILKNLQIKEIPSTYLKNDFELSELYDTEKRLHKERIKKERNKTWPKDKRIKDEKLWERVQSNATNKKILKILTFCLNLNSVYSGINKYRIEENANASINFYSSNNIKILNNKLWVLKLFEGEGVTL